jgi:hypothetical protein
LLLLLLRPGAGVLSDGHRISFDDPRRKIQTHPQMLPVGLRISAALSQQNDIQQTRKG